VRCFEVGVLQGGLDGLLFLLAADEMTER